MKYLQTSFSVRTPETVFGCAACIYGERHGYDHTFGEGCAFAPKQRRCRDITCKKETTDPSGLCPRQQEYFARVHKASKGC